MFEKLPPAFTVLLLDSKYDIIHQSEISMDRFLLAIRRFMDMKTLTPSILRELVERIDVYHIQGTGKDKRQKIVIHYRFMGVIEFSKPFAEINVTLDSRQGVSVEYQVIAS